ncbi:hypothetical protein [Streptomyces goshikiensis]|uniref:hypothetical protein n=1 Tax=Streptomyces goshikiensis TaxID=1942 RepID=UPI00365ACD63
MSTPTLAAAAAVAAPNPYAAGLSEGRVDAAANRAVTAVRAAWIAEFADPDYGEGYRVGLHFDRTLETALRNRRGRP